MNQNLETKLGMLGKGLEDSQKRKVYSYEEVLKSSTEYFGGDELAATTWMKKYAVKDKSGDYLESNPDDMHRRMAKEFARVEKKYSKEISPEISDKFSEYGRTRENLTEEKIYEFFKNFEQVIPQGSVMASLGNENVIASLSNCIVLPEVYDSYGGIMYTDQQMAQLFKRRCGVGIDISTLRPKNSDVSNAAGKTSGAVSFMNRYSNTTREVAQNGRRGALMITMDIAHPDVEDFVKMKQDLSKVTGANVSVRLSDEFMDAVVKEGKYTHRWPINSENPEFTKEVDAKELWDEIVKCAHNTAEPGLIFWDRQHKYSTSSVYPGFENVSTNPCSEIAMQGGDSCRLIAMNLYDFVENPFTNKAKFNYEKFSKITYESQRLMDDLVDLELEAIDRINKKIDSDLEPDHIKSIERETWKTLYEAGKSGRRTGLGFTALGDTVAALGYQFDSEDAKSEIDKIMRTKLEAEFNSSIDMALERGKFENFDPKYENQSEFVNMIEKEFPSVYERMMENGRRNISLSTVAPTGTLSMLAQTSSGIEPIYMLSYKRRRKVNPNEENSKVAYVDDSGDSWEEFEVFHPKLKKWMEISGNEEIEKSPYHGSTAQEIDWIKRVDIQSIIQKYTTHSISSTINLPEDVPVEKVGEIYIEAWKKGLKGITVYRDGSRSGVLISKDKKNLENKLDNEEFKKSLIEKINRPRPEFVGGMKEKIQTPHGYNAFVSVNWEKDEEGNLVEPYEAFVEIGKAGDDLSAIAQGFGRSLSLMLKAGIPYEMITEQLTGIGGDSQVGFGEGKVKSLPDAIGKGMEKSVEKEMRISGLKKGGKKNKKGSSGNLCNNCGSSMIREEGCEKCPGCGFTKCN